MACTIDCNGEPGPGHGQLLTLVNKVRVAYVSAGASGATDRAGAQGPHDIRLFDEHAMLCTKVGGGSACRGTNLELQALQNFIVCNLCKACSSL